MVSISMGLAPFRQWRHTFDLLPHLERRASPAAKTCEGDIHSMLIPLKTITQFKAATLGDGVRGTGFKGSESRF
jgi:hypothetical protein